MDVFTVSLRSACSLRRGHFVNNLSPSSEGLFFLFHSILLN
ncbi:gluconate 5-dehydrogenase [Yersinia pseudotuberculosis]|nr:gluconate 5-dehydrogenase [Yersinia pseudotuberculosis]